MKVVFITQSYASRLSYLMAVGSNRKFFPFKTNPVFLSETDYVEIATVVRRPTAIRSSCARDVLEAKTSTGNPKAPLAQLPKIIPTQLT